MRRVLAANRLVENQRVFIFLGGPEVDGSASAGRGNRLLTRAVAIDRLAHGHSLTVAAAILALAFSTTFDTNFIMQALADGL